MTVTTYATYLHLDELLSLQRPMTPAEEQDLSDSERLFIVVHQASETLLSQVLVDLRHIEAGCCRERCYAYRTERAIRLIDSLDGQLTLLRRTLRREDFLLFRDRFGTASGLQSEQFSELFDLTDRLTAPDGDLGGDLTGDLTGDSGTEPNARCATAGSTRCARPCSAGAVRTSNWSSTCSATGQAPARPAASASCATGWRAGNRTAAAG